MKLLIILFFIGISSSAYKFPDDFKFGIATSSYQIEGAWDTNGKGLSIWDYSTHTFPENIKDRSNGDIACDSYNKIDEDIKNLKALKVNFYRFSLSWPRILPTGFANKVNPDGIRFYNEIIDKLIENNIEPMVTLFHWDLPQSLQELGGWANPKIVKYFEDYVKICYENFGDRVKIWNTINEPHSICQWGYGTGEFAPHSRLTGGIGNYWCGHHVILSHAKAYNLYKKEFFPTQKGRVGFVVDSAWNEPESDEPEAIEVAERKLQMVFGWFLNPIFSKEGDYPAIMRERIDKKSQEQGYTESRLPYFTKEEIEEMKGTSDFLGLNHYASYLCAPTDDETDPNPSLKNDVGAYCYYDPSWQATAKPVFKVVPWGLRKLLIWIKERYNNPEVIITENGYSGFQNETTNDEGRINYYNSYLEEVLKAIHEHGCNVTGYTAWSFMDNFEWSTGYTERFGMYYVDFKDPKRPRTPKDSAYVYENIIVTRKINKKFRPKKFLH